MCPFARGGRCRACQSAPGLLAEDEGLRLCCSLLSQMVRAEPLYISHDDTLAALMGGGPGSGAWAPSVRSGLQSAMHNSRASYLRRARCNVSAARSSDAQVLYEQEGQAPHAPVTPACSFRAAGKSSRAAELMVLCCCSSCAAGPRPKPMSVLHFYCHAMDWDELPPLDTLDERLVMNTLRTHADGRSQVELAPTRLPRCTHHRRGLLWGKLLGQSALRAAAVSLAVYSRMGVGGPRAGWAGSWVGQAHHAMHCLLLRACPPLPGHRPNPCCSGLPPGAMVLPACLFVLCCTPMQGSLAEVLRQRAEAAGGAALVGRQVWLYHFAELLPVPNSVQGTWFPATITAYLPESGEHEVGGCNGMCSCLVAAGGLGTGKHVAHHSSGEFSLHYTVVHFPMARTG